MWIHSAPASSTALTCGGAGGQRDASWTGESYPDRWAIFREGAPPDRTPRGAFAHSSAQIVGAYRGFERDIERVRERGLDTYLGAEGGEVGGEDGWGDDDGVLVARVHLGVGGHVERGASLGGDSFGSLEVHLFKVIA